MSTDFSNSVLITKRESDFDVHSSSQKHEITDISDSSIADNLQMSNILKTDPCASQKHETEELRSNTDILQNVKFQTNLENCNSDTHQRELTDAILKLNISHNVQMPKFQKGQNFSTFCERFQQYAIVSRLNDPNLYRYFLLNVDNETYTTLKSTELTNAQKADANLFCPIYKQMFYGNLGVLLRNEVRDCRQNSTETITEYAHKLRETANAAFSDHDAAEYECFLTFLGGVHDPGIKRKLNESTSLNNFEDALQLAKRLEKIEKTFNSDDTGRNKTVLNQNESEKSDRSNLRTSNNIEDFKFPKTDSENKFSSKSPHNNGSKRTKLQATDHNDQVTNYNDHTDQKNQKWRWNNYRRRNKLVCWKCLGIGHKRVQCWQYSRENKSAHNFKRSLDAQNCNANTNDDNRSLTANKQSLNWTEVVMCRQNPQKHVKRIRILTNFVAKLLAKLIGIQIFNLLLLRR